MPPIEREVEEECGLLTSTCLKPKHSLRRQLFTAFGIASVTAIVVVTLIATLTASSAGQNVKAQARSSLEEQAKTNLGSSSRYVADAISKKFENLDGMVSLIEQATLDRFAGYPDHPGYAADENVPFRDLISGQGRYPLTFGSETSTSESSAVRCFSALFYARFYLKMVSRIKRRTGFRSFKNLTVRSNDDVTPSNDDVTPSNDGDTPSNDGVTPSNDDVNDDATD